MRFLFRAAAATLVTAGGLAAAFGSPAAADLIHDLPCALPSTGKGVAAEAFCIKIYNTCNTPITSTVKDTQTGEDKDTPQIPPGQTGKVCGGHKLELLGHTLGGP